MKRKLTLSSHYNGKEAERVTLGIKGVKDEKEFRRMYELGRDIGYGSHATVQVARCRDTGKIYACKCINKNSVSHRRIRDEVEILMSVDHSNIVRLHGAFETERHVLLVLDHASGGELYSRVVKKEKYTEREAQRVIFYLLKACTYLHSRNVVHRDIKLENILLGSSHYVESMFIVNSVLDSEGSNSNILVCDFGLAKVLNEEPPQKASTSEE